MMDTFNQDAQSFASDDGEPAAPYVCPECGEGFQAANALGSHRHYKHAITADSPTTKPRPKPPAKQARTAAADHAGPLCEAAEVLLSLVEQAAVGGTSPDPAAVNAARWRLGAAIADYRERVR